MNFNADIAGIAMFSYLLVKALNAVIVRSGYEEIVMGQYSCKASSEQVKEDSYSPEIRRRWLY